MPIERINEIYDIPALQAQQEQVIGLLKQTADAIVKANDLRLTTKGSDLSGFTKAADELNQVLNQSTTAAQKTKTAHTELAESIKQHERVLTSIEKAQARGNALTSDSAIELAKLNLQNQVQAKANKEVAQSVLGLVDDYGLLKREYNEAAAAAKNLQTIALNTGNADDKGIADAATAKARALHDSLLSIEQGVGQSQRNVGNYTGALKILEGALTESKQKLDSMTASEVQNTQAGQKLQHEVTLLSSLVGQQDKGFISLRREIANATQALATMAEQGLSGTASFKELQLEVASGRRELNEFNNQQKLLSSEVPAIAGLTAAAKGLGAAYAIGAGASALFAEGNEKVEKELNKLVAVMTLLQGLTEVNKTLQESTAIATSLRGVKEAILNGVLAIRNFILTGSIKAQVQANTVEGESILIKEADAIATGEVAAASTVATAAATAFRVALIATGIGAFVILLISAVSSLGLFSNKAEEAKRSIDLLNESIDKNNEVLNESIQNLDRQGQLSLEDTKQRQAQQIAAMRRRGATDEEIKKQEIKNAKEVGDEEVKNMREVEVKQYESYQRLKVAQDAFNAQTLSGLKKLQRLGFDETDQAEFLAKRKADGQKLSDNVEETRKKADEIRFQADLKEKQALTKSLEEVKAKREKAQSDESQLLKEYLKKLQEQNKLASENELKLAQATYKTIYEDSTKSFDDRLQALAGFYIASEKLNAVDTKAQLDALDLQIKIDTEKAKKIKNSKLREDTLSAITKEGELARLNITQSSLNNQQKLFDDNSKTTKAIVKEEYDYMVKAAKDAYKEIEDVINRNAKATDDQIDINKNEKLIQLDKDFNNSKILGIENYNRRKADIEDEATRQSILNDENKIKSQEAAFGISLDLQRKLSDDESKLNDLNQTKAQRKRDAEIAGLKTIQEVANDTFEIIGGLLNAQATATKNRLDAQQAQYEKDAQTQIDLVNATATTATNTEQDKAAQITIINARLAAQKEAIARKEKEADIQKAKFDKAAAIFNIILNTAQAVIKALPNIPLAIAIGAFGAAQLAVAIATPIPKYKHGRGEGREELAMVGDGGVSEYILRNRTGKIEKTPAVETLTHLMPKDRVFKNKEAMMKELAMSNLSNFIVTANGSITKNDIENMTDRLEGAIGEIKFQHTTITKAGWRTHTERLRDYDNWVEKYIKN